MRKRIGIYILPSLTGMIILLLGLSLGNSMLFSLLVVVGIIVLGLSASMSAPLLARKEVDQVGSKIEWRDERNTVIREKASWCAGMILIVAMSGSALALVLTDQLIGACVIAGLLLLYSLSIMVFSTYFSKKL